MAAKGADRIKQIIKLSEAIDAHEKEIRFMSKADAYHCIRQWVGEEGLTDNLIRQSLKSKDIKLSRQTTGARRQEEALRVLSNAVLSLCDILCLCVGEPYEGTIKRHKKEVIDLLANHSRSKRTNDADK